MDAQYWQKYFPALEYFPDSNINFTEEFWIKVNFVLGAESEKRRFDYFYPFGYCGYIPHLILDI